jgi:hypothetical protein
VARRYLTMSILLDPETTARFWTKVDKNGPVPAHKPELGPCWVWTGSIGGNGYGRMNLGQRGVRERAHRIGWIITNGEIPEGLYVLHRCDNPRCVNSERHLFLGTQADNMADMADKARGKRSKLLTDEEIVELRLAYSKGERQTALAARFGVSQSLVSLIVRGDRIRYAPVSDNSNRPSNLVSGTDHPKAVLDEEKVREIRKAYIDGMSVYEISKSFGVNWTTADRVVKRKTWKHVQ